MYYITLPVDELQDDHIIQEPTELHFNFRTVSKKLHMFTEQRVSSKARCHFGQKYIAISNDVYFVDWAKQKTILEGKMVVWFWFRSTADR